MTLVPTSQPQQPAVQPEPEPPAAMAVYIRAGKGLLLRILRKRWPAVGMCLASVLLCSLAVAMLFAQKSWQGTATLLYTPLPVPEQFRELYDPPSLKGLVPLVTTRASLEAFRNEFDLPIPARSLAKLIKAESPKGSPDMLTISFQWGSARESADMVNMLVGLFREEVARVRGHALNSYYADLDDYLGQCKVRLASARTRLRGFTNREDVVDAKEDLTAVQLEITAMQAMLEKERREDKDVQAQLTRLNEHIAGLRRQETADADKAEQYRAADESVADARRRQDRLRELIDDERRVMEVEAQLRAKRREYERAAKLAAKQLIPQSQLERIQGEMESLIARISESEEIIKWKKELQRIDKTVVPKGKAKQTGSPIITQVLFRKLELDLKLLAIQQEIYQLQRDIAAKRGRREKILRSRHEFQALQDDIDAVDDERRATEERMAVLRKLKALGPVELSIVSPARPEKSPAGSNRKILLLGAFLLGMMICGAGLLGLEMRSSGLVTVEDRLWQLGLPLLGTIGGPARGKRKGTLIGEKSVRRLALQIRQAVRHAGALILFSSLNRRDRNPELLAALAWCFARRDERVLVCIADDSPIYRKAFDQLIDSEAISGGELITFDREGPGADGSPGQEPSARGRPGLADFLSFTVIDLPEFIFPSVIPGVDCLLVGESNMPAEGFATQRMNELLGLLRRRYSILLLHAPPVCQDDDLRLLVAYADGIVTTAEAGANVAPEARQVIRDLFRLRAPMIGAVIV